MSHPSTQTTTLASPVGALLRRWPLALVLVVALGAAGFFAGRTLAPTYTAEARVAVGPGDMSSGAIAGFPQSTRDMAADYARWVTQNGFVDVPAGVTVGASPVPESNVIRVTAEGGDEAATKAAAQSAADKLVSSVNTARSETDPAKTLAQVRQSAAAWAAAKTELDRATSDFSKINGSNTSTDAQYDRAAAALTKAQSTAAALQTQFEAQSEKYKGQISQASSSADLRSISRAEVVADTGKSLAQRYALLGAGLGLLIALLVSVFLERRRGRREA